MFDFLKNECIMNTCLILLLIAILILTIYNFSQINAMSYNGQNNNEFYCNCKTKQINKPLPNVVKSVNVVQPTERNKLSLYYTDWCGHSRVFLPVWEEIKNIVSRDLSLNTICEQFECESQKDQCMNPNIEGFPSILFTKSNGTIVKYNGARTSDAVIAFIKASQ